MMSEKKQNKRNVDYQLFLDMYSMILADGIVSPEELEKFYNIGKEQYGISDEELNKSVLSAGKTMIVPVLPEDKIRLLYSLAQIALADGQIAENERTMLHRYTLKYGIEQDDVDEFVEYLLNKAKKNIPVNELIKNLSECI